MEILKVSLTVFIVTLSFIAITSVDAVHYSADTTAVAVASGLANNRAASVTIHTPPDGARFAGNQSIQVNYRVRPGPRGDHVHLYVDGKEVTTLQVPEGNYEIGPLKAGSHTLAIKVVNRAHVRSGCKPR